MEVVLFIFVVVFLFFLITWISSTFHSIRSERKLINQLQKIGEKVDIIEIQKAELELHQLQHQAIEIFTRINYLKNTKVNPLSVEENRRDIERHERSLSSIFNSLQ